MIDHLTIAFPYYDSPEMLRVHLDYWRRLSGEYNNQVEAIIVDDGSQKYPAEAVLMEGNCPDFKISLLRIQENIPWNHGGAKNLAMDYVEEGWVLLTDIDHVLSVGNLIDLIEQEVDPHKIYQLERAEMLGIRERVPLATHLDSFLMTRKMFWEIGGYDEDLTGYWNGPCLPFRKASKIASKWVQLKGPTLFWYGNNIIKDANVEEWGREGSHYDIKKDPIMLEKQHAAARDYKPVNPLRFTWKQIL